MYILHSTFTPSTLGQKPRLTALYIPDKCPVLSREMEKKNKNKNNKTEKDTYIWILRPYGSFMRPGFLMRPYARAGGEYNPLKIDI